MERFELAPADENLPAVVALVQLSDLGPLSVQVALMDDLIEHRASVEGPGSLAPQNLLRLSIGLENVDDLIDGFVRFMDTPADFPGPVNLGNPGEFTILELANLVIEDEYAKVLNWLGDIEKRLPLARVKACRITGGGTLRQLRMDVSLEVPLIDLNAETPKDDAKSKAKKKA